MTNKVLKKSENQSMGINPVVAAVAGVVVGAGVAVAGVVAFNDKNNRDKVSTAVSHANDATQEKMDQAEGLVKKVLI
jgi:hypothetical protein